MNPRSNTPYDERTPPGPRGRRHPRRWSRPTGSLDTRLARARLVCLLERGRGVGDWIALSLAGIAIALVLAATAAPAAEGRMRAPHLGLDYALAAVTADAAGTPALARVYGAGPGLAGQLVPGDLVAVETPSAAGWYRVERVDVLACATPAPPGGALAITSGCREGEDTRAVILAWPVRLAGTGWI